MRLEVNEAGTGEQLVVFVHGVLDRGGSFRRVVALLRDECRMLWYDRRRAGGVRQARAPGLGVGSMRT